MSFREIYRLRTVSMFPHPHPKTNHLLPRSEARQTNEKATMKSLIHQAFLIEHNINNIIMINIITKQNPIS